MKYTSIRQYLDTFTSIFFMNTVLFLINAEITIGVQYHNIDTLTFRKHCWMSFDWQNIEVFRTQNRKHGKLFKPLTTVNWKCFCLSFSCNFFVSKPLSSGKAYVVKLMYNYAVGKIVWHKRKTIKEIPVIFISHRYTFSTHWANISILRVYRSQKSVSIHAICS